MASMVWLIIAATSILMGCCSIQTVGATLVPDLQAINLGGQVMCQDCTKGYGEWSHGTQPIKGSKVSVTCKDDRGRVIYYGSDETDGQGRFNMVVNKFLNGKELQANSCLVRLVSSSHPTCNIPTNFAGGQNGVKLPIRPSVVYRNLVHYELGTFFYTTPRCDKPVAGTNDTFDCNANDNNYNNNY